MRIDPTPTCSLCGMPASLHTRTQPVGVDACYLSVNHGKTARGAPPPSPPPPPAPSMRDDFGQVLAAIQPQIIQGILSFTAMRDENRRKTRNENKRSARFEIAAGKLAEAATWAILVADKPGAEWKDLLRSAVIEVQSAQDAILDPEPGADPPYPSPSHDACRCGAPCDVAADAHEKSCDWYAPKCSCDADEYTAPELHGDCDLGRFVRNQMALHDAAVAEAKARDAAKKAAAS